MASIRYRLAKGCKNWTYQVQIRRTGLPSFTISFITLEEAEKWVSENEEKFIEDPQPYLAKYCQKYAGARLELLRERHFKRRERIEKYNKPKKK
jgi:hypothetical protein